MHNSATNKVNILLKLSSWNAVLSPELLWPCTNNQQVLCWMVACRYGVTERNRYGAVRGKDKRGETMRGWKFVQIRYHVSAALLD
jgi:hypothetical protein